jgi:hypothetical protein
VVLYHLYQLKVAQSIRAHPEDRLVITQNDFEVSLEQIRDSA